MSSLCVQVLCQRGPTTCSWHRKGSPVGAQDSEDTLVHRDTCILPRLDLCTPILTLGTTPPPSKTPPASPYPHCRIFALNLAVAATLLQQDGVVELLEVLEQLLHPGLCHHLQALGFDGATPSVPGVGLRAQCRHGLGLRWEDAVGAPHPRHDACQVDAVLVWVAWRPWPQANHNL